MGPLARLLTRTENYWRDGRLQVTMQRICHLFYVENKKRNANLAANAISNLV